MKKLYLALLCTTVCLKAAQSNDEALQQEAHRRIVTLLSQGSLHQSGATIVTYSEEGGVSSERPMTQAEVAETLDMVRKAFSNEVPTPTHSVPHNVSTSEDSHNPYDVTDPRNMYSDFRVTPSEFINFLDRMGAQHYDPTDQMNMYRD